MKNILIIALCFIAFSVEGQDSLMTSKGVKRDTGSLFAPYKAAIQTNTTNVATNTSAISANYDSTFRFAFPFTDSTVGLGTSIVFGYNSAGGTLTGGSYFASAGRYFNKAVNNLAISATGSRKAYYQLSTNKNGLISYPLLTDQYFNNVRVTSGATVRYNTARSGMRAVAALQWLQNIQFIYSGISGTLNSNVTLSSLSGWGGAASEAVLLDYGSRTYWYRHNSTTQIGANMATKATTVANETMTITGVFGTGVAIGTFGVVSGYSRIQYAVDGTTYGTYDPNNQTYTGFIDGGTTDGIINDAIVVTNLKDTSHTVVLTFLDAATTKIDYVGGLISPWASKNIPIYVMDAYHMNSGASIGYNTPSYVTTAAVLDSASFYVQQNLTSTFPGYSFAFVPTNRYYDPSISTQIQIADGVHPTVLGNQNILKALQDVVVKYPIGGSNAGGLLGGVPNYLPIYSTPTNLAASNFFQDSTLLKSSSASKYSGISIKNTSTATNAQSWVSLGDDYIGGTNNIWLANFYPASRTTAGLVLPLQFNSFASIGLTGGSLFTNAAPSAPFVFSIGGTGASNEVFRVTPNTSTFTTPNLIVSNSSTKPLFKIVDGAGTNASYYNNYLNTANLAINRNPATGTFADATKGGGQFTLNGDATGAYFQFYTSNSVNATPVNTVTLDINGNLKLNNAGQKITIATGANASVGTATLVAGTVTVSTTAALTASLIYVTVKTAGGTQGFLSVPTIVNGTSFTVNSTSATETSTVNYWIIN